MHPTVYYRLGQYHAADLRRQAQRATLARWAWRAGPGPRGRAAPLRPAPSRAVRRKPSARTVLAIAALGSAVAFLDATIVNIAFPDIARSFPGTSISALSWVLNAYNIALAAFLMAGAGIAELIGRRRVFVFGLQLFTAGSLLCASAPSAGALIAFRAVQALGAALLVPSALALVLHAFPPAHRAHGVALLSAVGAAAAGLGPSLGGDTGEGPIIAVDVKATPARLNTGPDRARGRDDQPPRVPSLGETPHRLLLLGSENTSVAARCHADLVIKPHAEGVGLLEFSQLDAAREAGRVATREALERAPASLAGALRPPGPATHRPAESAA